jgi:site-specific recombinase XerD
LENGRGPLAKGNAAGALFLSGRGSGITRQGVYQIINRRLARRQRQNDAPGESGEAPRGSADLK